MEKGRNKGTLRDVFFLLFCPANFSPLLRLHRSGERPEDDDNVALFFPSSFFPFSDVDTQWSQFPSCFFTGGSKASFSRLGLMCFSLFFSERPFLFPFFLFCFPPLPVIRRDGRNKAKKVSEVEFDFHQALSKHIGWYFPST